MVYVSAGWWDLDSAIKAPNAVKKVGEGGALPCTNAEFGDPALGSFKRCWCATDAQIAQARAKPGTGVAATKNATSSSSGKPVASKDSSTEKEKVADNSSAAGKEKLPDNSTQKKTVGVGDMESTTSSAPPSSVLAKKDVQAGRDLRGQMSKVVESVSNSVPNPFASMLDSGSTAGSSLKQAVATTLEKAGPAAAAASSGMAMSAAASSSVSIPLPVKAEPPSAPPPAPPAPGPGPEARRRLEAADGAKGAALTEAAADVKTAQWAHDEIMLQEARQQGQDGVQALPPQSKEVANRAHELLEKARQSIEAASAAPQPS